MDEPAGAFTATSVPHAAPGLSELSPSDKPWDKHRSNNDRVAAMYATSEYDCYATRMHFCSELLEFRLTDNQGRPLKLTGARFCRVRHCPVCQWRRSLTWKAKACAALPRLMKDFPKRRWLFLTLTVKNCPVDHLRSTLTWMNQSFVRLTHLKAWPAEGWLKSVEITRGRGGSAHPHFHCLLMVPAGYFGAGYLSQKSWAELWRQSLRIDYEPMVHVKAVAAKSDPRRLIPEILKYQTKESDLVADRGWLLEYTRQMHKTRCVAVGGSLRPYMKAIEEEPEDLIGTDGMPDGSGQGNLYFDWVRTQKRYVLADC